MATNPISGIRYFLQGIPMIFNADIKKYVVVPLIINIVLFIGAIYLLVTEYESLIDWLTPELASWVPDFISGILNWFIGLLWMLFAAVALIIIFFGFTIVANIVGAPFNAYLASAVEYKLTGKQPIDPRTSFMKVTLETVGGELKKLAYLVMWVIPLLLISFIPVINIISPVLWAVFSAWMLALQYIDYPLGNRGYNFSKIRYTLSNYKMLSLGFGGSATVATMIPVLNFLVMPVSVAGATIMAVNELSEDDDNERETDATKDSEMKQSPLISR